MNIKWGLENFFWGYGAVALIMFIWAMIRYCGEEFLKNRKEYKGLKLESEKAVKEAILHHESVKIEPKHLEVSSWRFWPKGDIYKDYLSHKDVSFTEYLIFVTFVWPLYFYKIIEWKIYPDDFYHGWKGEDYRKCKKLMKKDLDLARNALISPDPWIRKIASDIVKRSKK